MERREKQTLVTETVERDRVLEALDEVSRLRLELGKGLLVLGLGFEVLSDVDGVGGEVAITGLDMSLEGGLEQAPQLLLVFCLGSEEPGGHGGVLARIVRHCLMVGHSVLWHGASRGKERLERKDRGDGTLTW
jgi:hypothetical protein